jgi:hypothetical protein
MPNPNKSYNVQAEKQENIGGVGAVSGFPKSLLAVNAVHSHQGARPFKV